MSLFKKIKTISKDGMDSVFMGMENYNNPDPCIEGLAKERSKTCMGCPLFNNESISFLKIKDKRIPVLDGMMCGECGCSSPYLLRQNIKICKKWKR